MSVLQALGWTPRSTLFYSLKPTLTRSRLRRDYPEPGDCTYAAFQEVDGYTQDVYGRSFFFVFPHKNNLFLVTNKKTQHLKPPHPAHSSKHGEQSGQDFMMIGRKEEGPSVILDLALGQKRDPPKKQCSKGKQNQHLCLVPSCFFDV